MKENEVLSVIQDEDGELVINANCPKGLIFRTIKALVAAALYTEIKDGECVVMAMRNIHQKAGDAIYEGIEEALGRSVKEKQDD